MLFAHNLPFSCCATLKHDLRELCALPGTLVYTISYSIQGALRWAPRHIKEPHWSAISTCLLQVCCSLDSSMVLAEDGTLYTFGDNSLGQLGRPSRPEHGPEDWIVRGDAGAPLKFERVAAGLGHCLAVTQDGQARPFLPSRC